MKSKDINFEYIEEFADYIVERVENDEELFLTVVGKFEEIKGLISEIFIISEVNFEKLYLYGPDVNGYTDEYVLDCWCKDGIVQIGCEPAKRDGKYLCIAGDETYLMSNCSSSLIPLCDGSDLYFVNIDDEYEYDEECDCECPCSCHKEDEDKTNDGISIRLKYNLDANEALEILDKIESRMFEVNKIFNEMNDMRNLFRF